MTQVFDKDKVVPVTAIDISGWLVTNVKTEENDGYSAIQVGCLKNKFKESEFKKEWLKKPTGYFSVLREIKTDPASLEIGSTVSFAKDVEPGSMVSVRSKSKGCGFSGAVKRHNFSGGRGSHGDTTGRRTGSIGFMTACGKVIKGKRMPGRMGGKQVTVKGLKLVDFKDNLILLKGAVPGKQGSLVYIQKSENE